MFPSLAILRVSSCTDARIRHFLCRCWFVDSIYKLRLSASSKSKSLTQSGIMKLPVRLYDLGLQGLFYWHWRLWVKNDPHFCGHGTVSAPPDLGAHSISWCIAPARDYAALSGAEEEMFRETDVPVSAVRLSLLLPRACHLTDWWITIPVWRAAPPLSPAHWPWQQMRSCICYRGDALLASFASAEWKSNGLMLRQSW